jgi:hypothetical protein
MFLQGRGVGAGSLMPPRGGQETFDRLVVPYPPSMGRLGPFPASCSREGDLRWPRSWERRAAHWASPLLGGPIAEISVVAGRSHPPHRSVVAEGNGASG